MKKETTNFILSYHGDVNDCSKEIVEIADILEANYKRIT